MTVQDAAGLVVDEISVRYGGHLAVDRMSLHAPPRQITGLIGPNGAGKTTTFNVCSGLLRPTTGTVHLDGKDVTESPVAARAQLGLGRTFQRMELFDSLTVRENVELGREAGMAGSLPWRHLRSRRSDAAEIKQATDEALTVCGLNPLAARRPTELSTGQRRLVELARVIAGGFKILLLDEPSSGLDKLETDRFGQILKQLVGDRGIGILCVEHDMGLVMDICDDVYVLDFGKPIFHGTTAELAVDPIVRAAYLGSADLGVGTEAAQAG
jgi:ABC-type branched-subunit amino acid transport system ATPase component